MIEGQLLPELNEFTEPFHDFASRGELRIQKCESCGVLRMPPRPRCHACGSTSFVWQLMSGRGRVWSYVVAHPPLLPAYAQLAPYVVAIVELEEDPLIRLCGNLVFDSTGPINEVQASDVTIGQEVTAVFPPSDDGFVLPVWQITGANESA